MGPFLNWREGEPEFNALWPVFVFFLVGFLLLILLLKAALAQFSIEVTVLSNAVIGALLAAKAALVLDETPLRRVWCVTVGSSKLPPKCSSMELHVCCSYTRNGFWRLGISFIIGEQPSHMRTNSSVTRS